MIRLIGIDLDGTLFDSKKTISPRNITAIEAALAMGVQVIPATGRQLVGVPEEFLRIPGVGYALTANGAVIWQLKPDRIISRDCFDAEKSLEIYRALRPFNTLTTIFCGHRGYYEAGELERVRHRIHPQIYGYLKSSREDVPSLEQIIRDKQDAVEKYSIFFVDMEERMQAKALFEAMPGLNVTSSMENNLELNTSTASKGQALLYLAGMLGLKQEETMAIGDSTNDLSMMQLAGFSVAMGNGEDVVKAAADAVTDTCDRDGVAKAIEKYVLNT